MPALITLSDINITFTVPGQTHKIDATVKNPKGKVINSSVTWSSSDATVATVDQTGLVTAQNKNGSVTITAIAGNVGSSAAVTVAIPASGGGGDNTPPPGGGNSGGTGDGGTYLGDYISVVLSASYSFQLEKPRRVPDTRWSGNPTIDGLSINVASNAALLDALNQCAAADPTKNHAIILDTSFNFNTNVPLPSRATGSGYIYIAPQSYLDGTFGKTHSQYMRNVVETQGQRIKFADNKVNLGGACKLAQFHTPNFGAFFTLAKAHHYWFGGIEFTLDPANTVATQSGFINTGGNLSTDPTSDYVRTIADVPHHINISHCIFDGRATGGGGEIRRGVYANGSWIGIRDCAFYGIANVGFDSQCVAYWNSPGAILLFNNFFECITEDVLGGGAGPVMDQYPEDFMKDITSMYNDYAKNSNLAPSGQKNLHEHKNGGRLYFTKNIVRDNKLSGQTGNSILFQTLNDSNISPPQQDIADVYINTIYCEGGGPALVFVGLAGFANSSGVTVWPNQPTRKVWVDNVYCKDIAGTLIASNGAAGFGIQLSNGVTDILFSHITLESSTQTFIFTGRNTINGVDTPAAKNLGIRDCLFGKGIYGSLSDTEGQAADGNATIQHDVDGVVNITNNVFYGVTTAPDSASSYPVGNFYVDKSAVGFASYVQQDPGALASTSPYHNAATDGTDIGADKASIDTMVAAVKETSTPW